MYGKELRLEHKSGERKRYLVRRRESEPSDINEIRSGSESISFKFAEGHVNFEIELDAGESSAIRITFRELDADGTAKETVAYRMKAMLRRYLCEVRDNYVTTAKLRFANFVSH
jgi:hypothetical protein